MGVTGGKFKKVKNHAGLRPRVMEDAVIVWFDPNISASDENIRESLNQLRPLIKKIKIFTDVDECIDFFSHVKKRNYIYDCVGYCW